MNKQSIIAAIVSSLMIFSFTGCNNGNTANQNSKTQSQAQSKSQSVSLIGRWYKTGSSNPYSGDYYEFDGYDMIEGHGSSSKSATYTIDSDGTLHIDAGFTTMTVKQTTIEEILKMDKETAYDYYAYDDEVLYFEGNSDYAKYIRQY